jgi:hypothetical protein
MVPQGIALTPGGGRIVGSGCGFFFGDLKAPRMAEPTDDAMSDDDSAADAEVVRTELGE